MAHHGDVKLQHAVSLSFVVKLSSACTPVAEGQEVPPPPVEETAAPVELAAAPTPEAKAEPKIETITISAIGDNTLGGPADSDRAKGSFQYVHNETGGDFARPFSGVISVLGDDDLTIGNLEGALTTQACRTDRPFAFRGNPAYANMLKLGSVEVVSLANNHSEDCGPGGVKETREALTAHGIGYFGLGTVDKRTVKGIEVVNIGFTGGAPGVRAEVEEAVKANKTEKNLVFVSFHWGIEGSHSFTDGQQKLGRAAIDAGADLVLGHHPHVVQGIENYKGKRIVYSLGNFVFGGNGQPGDLDTMIFRARFSFSDGHLTEAGYEIIPALQSGDATQNDFRPILASGPRAEAIREKVRKASPVGEPASVL